MLKNHVTGNRRVTKAFSSKKDHLLDGMFYELSGGLDHADGSEGSVKINSQDLNDGNSCVVSVGEDLDLSKMLLSIKLSVSPELMNSLAINNESIKVVAKVYDNKSAWADFSVLENAYFEYYEGKSVLNCDLILSDYLRRENVYAADVTLDFLMGKKPKSATDWVTNKKFYAYRLTLNNKDVGSLFNPEWKLPSFFKPESKILQIHYVSLTDHVNSDSVRIFFNNRYEESIIKNPGKVALLVRSELMASVLAHDDFSLSEDYGEGSIGKNIQKVFESHGTGKDLHDLREVLLKCVDTPLSIINYVLGESDSEALLK